jgi:hypothetical protein
VRRLWSVSVSHGNKLAKSFLGTAGSGVSGKMTGRLLERMNSGVTFFRAGYDRVYMLTIVSGPSECHTFPSLSSLLENERVRQHDSFMLCVQIQLALGEASPQLSGLHYMPRSVDVPTTIVLAR